MSFQGQGHVFKAKMIGFQQVEGARGDRLCQDTMAILKQRVKAAGVHKPKVTLNISLKGITIYDLLSGVSNLYTTIGIAEGDVLLQVSMLVKFWSSYSSIKCASVGAILPPKCFVKW